MLSGKCDRKALTRLSDFLEIQAIDNQYLKHSLAEFPQRAHPRYSRSFLRIAG